MTNKTTEEMKMSVVYVSFLGLGLIVLIVRETACEWQRYSGGGKVNLKPHIGIFRLDNRPTIMRPLPE